MAIYTCGKCKFCFERRGTVDVCPDCGNTYILSATKEELAQYKKEHPVIKKTESEK